MDEQPRNRQPLDEQQTVTQSPIEEEIRETRPGALSASDRYTIFGYSIGIVLAAAFILFALLIVIVLLVR